MSAKRCSLKNETPHFFFGGFFMEFWLCCMDKALVKCFSLSSTYLVLCKASFQELEMYAEHQSIWEHRKLPKDVLLRGDSCACPFSSENCVWSSWCFQIPQIPPGACKYLYAPKYGLIGPERSRIPSSAGCRCHPCLCLQEGPLLAFSRSVGRQDQSTPSFICTSVQEQTAACKIRQAFLFQFISLP